MPQCWTRIRGTGSAHAVHPFACRQDRSRLIEKSQPSPLVRVCQAVFLLLLSALVVFGCTYGALALYNRNNPAPSAAAATPNTDAVPAAAAAGTTGTLSASSMLPMVARLYDAKYTAAKEMRRTPGTPRVRFFNGTFDDDEMPVANLSSGRPVPPAVVGWATLMHKDAQYGPARPDSPAEEYEEVIEQITDPSIIAELESLVPDGVEMHTEGFQPIPTPPTERRQLFFEPPASNLPVGVLTAADRRVQSTCNDADTRAHLNSVVDLLSGGSSTPPPPTLPPPRPIPPSLPPCTMYQCPRSGRACAACLLATRPLCPSRRCERVERN